MRWQPGAFLLWWGPRLRRHIARREGFDPTLLANFRAQDRKAF
jgi:hypothetical protein